MRSLAPFFLIVLGLIVGPALGCAAVLGLDSGSSREQLEDAGGAVDSGIVVDQTAPPPVDADHADGSVTPTCAVGERLCGNTCAKPTDPKYGCGSTSCQACSLPHTATAACGAGGCVVAPSGCNAGFADCDGTGANGCEADLGTPATCGTCMQKCSGVNSICQTPSCVSSCVAPNQNCGGACVNVTNNPTHCGVACKDCTVANSTPSCTASVCSFTCNSGYGDCNAIPTDGCETQTNTNTHCGSCGNDCTLPNPIKHIVGACQTGTYCTPIACESGWYDCDGNLADGCECQGAGCCTPTDGAPNDSGWNDSGACQPPGSTCDTANSKCCGSCMPGASVAPVPEVVTPGTCCALSGQNCNQASDCCNGTATCAGTCSS